MADAARHLRQELLDRTLLPLLLDNPSEWILNESETFHGLADIEARAKKALQRPEFQTKGRHQVRPLFGNTLNPLTMCALMIGISWRRARDAQWPGQHNSTATSACTLLWRAAVAKDAKDKLWNKTDDSWWRYLRDAKKIETNNNWQARTVTQILGFVSTPDAKKKPNGRLAAVLYRRG